MNRCRVHYKKEYADNTIAILLKFCSKNSYADDIDSDKIFVTDYKVSPDDITIVLTSKNILSNRKFIDLIIYLDTTYKVIFNRFPVYIISCIDKQ